ncbi:MAG: hypothetical protein ABS894_00600 [Aerococcus urinaeequi]
MNRLEPEREEIIIAVKRRMALDVTDLTHDSLIGSYVDEVGFGIRNYIQQPKIPYELSYVWAAMVASALTTEQMNVLRPPTDDDEVSLDGFKIKIGDTSIEPSSAAKKKPSPGVPSMTVIDDVIRDYTGQLMRFRRMVWR